MSHAPWLYLWIATILLETALAVILWRRNVLPWLAVWVAGNALASVSGLAVRSNGPAYAALWTPKQVLLLLLLILAIAEIARHCDFPHVAVAGSFSVLAWSLLRAPYRWPNSELETIFAALALVQVAGGILVAMHWRDAQYQAISVVMCCYLLFTAACYYSAPVFPESIGRAVMSIEFLSVVAWIWLAVAPPQK